MQIYIVKNPYQTGATDGVCAICDALKKRIPDIEYSIIEKASEIIKAPDIVWTVGPDRTEIGLEIIKAYKPKFVFGMKDPFHNSEVECYAPYNKIIDSMGTLRDSKIYKEKPNLIYFPDFPPFTLSKEKIDGSKSAEILKIFAPNLLFSIGGADPYTQKDLSFADIDRLLQVANSFTGKVAWTTSTRTSQQLIEYIKSNLTPNSALYDYKRKAIFYNNNEIPVTENIFYPFVSSSDYIIQTDDSLSMMAELTVAEKQLMIYQTEASNKEETPQRLKVCNTVKQLSGAISFNQDIKNAKSLFENHFKTTSLEGIIDNKIADILYEIMK